MIRNNPEITKDWDAEVGDRMVKLVFIGKDMDKHKIIEDLNSMIIKYKTKLQKILNIYK